MRTRSPVNPCMGAWVARYLLFAAAAPGAVYWMIALGILLHGI